MKLTLLLVVSLSSTFSIIIFFIVFYIFYRKNQSDQNDVESRDNNNKQRLSSETEEELVKFHGGDDLTISDILDAPGEVIGKSSYGTLYKASLQRSGKIRALRFLRPVCTVRSDSTEFNGVIETLGSVRHENLVPLLGFYGGIRGEKLMVHPFFNSGNLYDFIKNGDDESIRWSNIINITIGISKAIDHLHTGIKKPIIHGNLKSKNILLNQSFKPRVSDFGLHLLLNQTAGQDILDVSEAEGYKAPELIKMKEVSKESDVYSLGVIMLELVSGKEPNPTSDDEFYLLEFMRKAVLDHNLAGLYRPEILRSDDDNLSEECVLKYVHLALSCCSHLPSLRPNTMQVLKKLEEIRRRN
ncbi:unnamed protein product [Cochlearia groenlandica]